MNGTKDTEVFEKIIAKALNLEAYTYLIENLYKTNVYIDKEYQKTYNYFYKIRRNEEWRNIYFEYLEKVKNDKNLKFEDIIRYLYRKTGNVECSFASKILATINPNMPVWDKYVLNNLNMKLNGKTESEKIENAIHLYRNIIEWYEQKLKDEQMLSIIMQFKETLPHYELSETKIIDYVLWTNR